MLPAAETLVKGVFTPLRVAVGVEDDVTVLPPLDAVFAAFSAKRFCLEAEGAMVDGGGSKKLELSKKSQAPIEALGTHRNQRTMTWMPTHKLLRL